MARGAQKTAENNANAGYVGSQQFNAGEEQKNAAIQNYLMPQYKNLIQHPGYDRATKSAITNASEGAAAATYGGAEDAVARSAARTGNEAGAVAGMDKLAQDKARTMSDVAAKDQIQFADAARSDVRTGLAGMSGLYGVDQQLLARSLGIPPEYLQQYNNARYRQPGFTTAFEQAAGKGFGVALAGPGGV